MATATIFAVVFNAPVEIVAGMIVLGCTTALLERRSRANERRRKKKLGDLHSDLRRGANGTRRRGADDRTLQQWSRQSPDSTGVRAKCVNRACPSDSPASSFKHVPHTWVLTIETTCLITFKNPVTQMEASMLVGYARTSTEEQLAGLEAQLDSLKAEGCTKTFQERVSSVAQRDQLTAALEFTREGDTLVVTKMDRLARSTQHLLEIVEGLEAKGVALRILDFKGDTVDTHSPTGKLILTMFAAFAQFERELMLDRQRHGIAKAKAEGKYKGRKPTARAQADQVKALVAEGVGPSEIARRLEIGRSSVHRILRA
jgi:DNA invertase Pin-like site-specific DNA recombinase